MPSGGWRVARATGGFGGEKARLGYRRLHVLLRQSGERVNHKRVWRVYREAGLCVKRKRRKRLTRKLKELLTEARRWIHAPVAEQHRWLSGMLRVTMCATVCRRTTVH